MEPIEGITENDVIARIKAHNINVQSKEEADVNKNENADIPYSLFHTKFELTKKMGKTKELTAEFVRYNEPHPLAVAYSKREFPLSYITSCVKTLCIGELYQTDNLSDNLKQHIAETEKFFEEQ